MINKPEKILKRITKAVGQRQAVLTIGEWDQFLVALIKENENAFTQILSTNELASLESNSFTRIIADYNLPIFENGDLFFTEARRLLLPTGQVIISADCEDGILDKLFKFFKKDNIIKEEVKKIKPKVLQNQIHDNGFLIDGYYGYPGGYLLMMAQIQNKEVTTLFGADKQETIKNKTGY